MRGGSALALMLLLVSGAAAAAGEGTADSSPTAAVEAFHAALAAKNRDAALALLDREVVIFESGDAELSRDDYAEHHLGADMEFVSATRTEITSRESGADGDVAWVLTRSKTSGSFRGKEVATVGAETMVLSRRDDGSWRIVHVHWSSHAAKR